MVTFRRFEIKAISNYEKFEETDSELKKSNIIHAKSTKMSTNLRPQNFLMHPLPKVYKAYGNNNKSSENNICFSRMSEKRTPTAPIIVKTKSTQNPMFIHKTEFKDFLPNSKTITIAGPKLLKLLQDQLKAHCLWSLTPKKMNKNSVLFPHMALFTIFKNHNLPSSELRFIRLCLLTNI